MAGGREEYVHKIQAAARSIELMYQKLKEDGTTIEQIDRLMSFDDFNELIGVNEKFTLAERFGVE